MGAVKRGYIHFPSNWEHVESQGFAGFVTRVVHRTPDGALDVRTSRRNRKRFGSQRTEKNPTKYFLWKPRSLNWRISILFMIGSSFFILGSILVLANFQNVTLNNLIFFIGSIFFTSAGYSQFYQSINAPLSIQGPEEPFLAQRRRFFAWQPNRIDYWVTFSQFLGTLAFNMSTFAAILTIHWLGYDLLVWRPDYIGSILFLVSGVTAVLELCHRFWCWNPSQIDWWIVMINLLGCIAFMISAIAAFVRPEPNFENLAYWATVFTLIGALCFFIGAYLMLPEMSMENEE